jgi:hypothetical protein
MEETRAADIAALLQVADTVAFLQPALHAADRPAARRAEAVPVEARAEALPEAAILRPGTAATTDSIFTPFHPTPHSPSGGSERSLLPTSSGAEGENKFSQGWSACGGCCNRGWQSTGVESIEGTQST